MKTNNNSGVILVAVVCFTAITAILALGLLSESGNQLKLADRQVRREQAFYVAEGGAERAVAYIAKGGVVPASLSNTIGNGTYSVAVNSVAGGVGQTWYTIASTGNVQGVKRCVTMSGVRSDSWARFAVWTDHNAGGNYFMGPSVFNGPIHANDPINLWGNPTFNALVTSAATNWGNWSAAAVFSNGFQLGVATQQLSSTINFTNTANTNNCLRMLAGLVVTGATSIRLQNTNVFISNSGRGWTNANYSTNHSDFLATGMIYIATSGTNIGTVQIGSTNFNGRLTIVADQDIQITNHLTYADNPVTNLNSDDALGLIARRDVVVMTSAPSNLNIYAHIIACNPITNWYAGFYVQNSAVWGEPDRGLLTIYGGIVENNFGVEGCYWGGGTFTGFSQDNWVYDTRFANNPPPFYPSANTAYTWSNWREGPAQ